MKARHAAIVVALVSALVITASGQESQEAQGFRFRTGVELINVTATVTDSNGRFVSGLRKEDFQLFEDGQEQAITHFNAERVPVSLGLVVDTSGSMEGDKWASARQARYRRRPRLRATSRLTVEGARPRWRAIARNEAPATSWRLISSRSASDSRSGERARPRTGRPRR